MLKINRIGRYYFYFSNKLNMLTNVNRLTITNHVDS